MGNIRQTKYSGNSKWSDVLFHNEIPGDSPANAIELTVNTHSPNYNFRAFKQIWVKFTSISSDHMNFYIFADGLFPLTNDIANYHSFQSDAATEIDIGNQTENLPAGSGPDFQGRETWTVSLDFSYQVGQTYYLSFIVPFTGAYGLHINVDD